MGTLILVDDDRSSSTLLKMLLEMDGFDVTVCPNAETAAAAAASGVDAFIIDIYLAQGESGLDLVQAIRSGITPASKDCPVVVTSGDERRRGDAERSGATTFLLKPFSPSQLSELISQLVA
jgi:two-component system response regulator CpxR